MYEYDNLFLLNVTNWYSSLDEKIRIRNCSVKLVVAARLKVDISNYKQSSKELKGFDSRIQIATDLDDPVCKQMFEIVSDSDINGPYLDLYIRDIPKGSIIVFQKKLDEAATIKQLQENLAVLYPSSDWITNAEIPLSARNAVAGLDFLDLNVLLYRSDPEERDFTGGHGVYNIPGYGDIAYCGLQGFVSVLGQIALENNLGHPMCNNLREGCWMLEYIVDRLKR